MNGQKGTSHPKVYTHIILTTVILFFVQVSYWKMDRSSTHCPFRRIEIPYPPDFKGLKAAKKAQVNHYVGHQ